jgi:glycerol-3-phosphate acyltransferase PlsY
MIQTIGLLALSYLLGSILFAPIFAKVLKLGDIRKVGSGNPGATNILRMSKLHVAMIVAVLDMAKATAAVLIGREVSGSMAIGALSGLAALIGHIYPIFFKFKGGKGMAAIFGVMMGISPILFLTSGAIWLIVALGTGYSSAAALVTLTFFPLFGFFYGFWIGIISLAMSLVAVLYHRPNIENLINGTESKIKWKK